MNFAERQTYRLVIEYDGTDFRGWQLQKSGRTVQGCFEEAIFKLFGERVRVSSAGRTDAGVHASGQVVHFRVQNPRSIDIVFKALNCLLPPDVRVLKVELSKESFHSRFSACWRGYEYRIAKSPMAIGRQYCWWGQSGLDLDLMRSASGYCFGTHNFRSFAHPNPKEKHYLSTVYRQEWFETDKYYTFQIDANRFLHGMVRFLVGTFVDVSRGRIDPMQIPEILEAQDVRRAGQKAPSFGLVLRVVGYSPWPGL